MEHSVLCGDTISVLLGWPSTLRWLARIYTALSGSMVQWLVVRCGVTLLIALCPTKKLILDFNRSQTFQPHHHSTHLKIANMPSTYKKDKPWDTDDIDKWKVEPFKPEDNVGGHFVEESSFATLFPKVR
jgi:hypothetical protein